jgi:uncharacterized protein (UPF0333 family)
VIRVAGLLLLLLVVGLVAAIIGIVYVGKFRAGAARAKAEAFAEEERLREQNRQPPGAA